MTRRPDLFIIGAPKSGTTSLYEYLIGHPGVYMSPVKEPFYFAPDVVTGPRRRSFRYGVDEQRYLDLFVNARDEVRVGEASTGYMISERAASLVRQFRPDARVIAMVRNPIDVIHALHNERVSHGVEDITEFESALAVDVDRRAGRRLPEGSSPLGAVYLDCGRFGEQLGRWLDELGRDRVHIVVFEDFAADTAGSFRGVLEFLDVDPEYQPTSFALHNPSHRMRGGILGRIRGARVGRTARRLAPRLIGENRAFRWARQIRHSRLARRRGPLSPISTELRIQLEETLRPDVVQLSEIVGRDLAAMWFRRSEDNLGVDTDENDHTQSGIETP